MRKEKRSVIVQELCKKLKLQLDQLGIDLDEAPQEKEGSAKRKDLLKSLQKQLAELSS